MKTRILRQLAGVALGATILAFGNPTSRATKPVAERAPEQKRPVVQLAILLDTSGSMEGLIEQAKGQLWKIVNEFISARQNGKTPEVQVALFEYGKSSLPASEGYIRLIQPLSNDLDKISEELFALKTDGGDEYCGWVIQEAVKRLAWSDAPDVYRAVFIAGNEPFTQGKINYADACKAAIAKGIVINTIHCGGLQEGISTKWQDGALLADGKFMSIDQNQAVAHLEAPQDAEITRLSTELNQTYVAFGEHAEERLSRQNIQDVNASSLAPQGAAVSRALTKASANYRNSEWDLVDAVKEKKVKLAELKKEELPKELEKLSVEEREAYVDKKAQERAVLQAKINELNKA
ncbi:MAG TPA: VWA domain-containing protein, partial [Candidatus Kapabacteria bacterium]|nr:VWA domain-containing protein [Candidatus Kapabacteria bacterium]